MSPTASDLLRDLLLSGYSVDDALAEGQAAHPDLTREDVFTLADALADQGQLATRHAPPTDAVGRRDVLRSLLASAASVAGVAGVAGAATALPRAAHALPPGFSTDPFGDEAAVCGAGVDFRAREAQIKRAQSSNTLRGRPGLAERRRKQQIRESSIKKGFRYQTSGPAPAWIDVEGGEEIALEMEQSSVRLGDEASCTCTLDLIVDDAEFPNIKTGVEKLRGLSTKGDAGPFLTVEWGPERDQAFQGFLTKVEVAYTAFSERDEPVRARVRATFLMG